MKNLVFDIGGTAIKGGIWTDGALSNTFERPTDARLGGPHIMDTVSSIIKEHPGCDAVGISTAGQVNSEEGFIIYANSNIPQYTGVRIRARLEEDFHIPVMVENDVNCAAIGEAVYGTGKGFPDFLCLTYGTGVGGALIQDGRLYHGSSFSAGEFGGIVTHAEENKAGGALFDGCYERYASATALVRAAAAYDPALDSGRAVFKRLEEDGVRSVVDGWIDEILYGLITVIHIFNPPLVVLGGGVMSQPYVVGQIQKKLSTRIMPSFSHVQIAPAALGNHAGLLGAGYLTQLYAASRKG